MVCGRLAWSQGAVLRRTRSEPHGKKGVWWSALRGCRTDSRREDGPGAALKVGTAGALVDADLRVDADVRSSFWLGLKSPAIPIAIALLPDESALRTTPLEITAGLQNGSLAREVRLLGHGQ